MADLSEADLKFVLSVDPDEEALNKAIEQINTDIDAANVKKIRLNLEKEIPKDVLPVPPEERPPTFGGNLGKAAAKPGALAAPVVGGLDVVAKGLWPWFLDI
jgi:hypothetical protein